MMVKMTSCIRCGKLRILDRIWSEKVGTSQLVHTDTVCPDAVCQKLVETLLKNRHDELDARIKAAIKRREENRKKGMRRLKS